MVLLSLMLFISCQHSDCSISMASSKIECRENSADNVDMNTHDQLCY
jgi:hypothetical protein